MPFPNHVVVSLQNEKGFSCPPQEFREKMIAEMKFFFGGKLESDINQTSFSIIVSEVFCKKQGKDTCGMNELPGGSKEVELQ